jgi:hypothetical protein
MNCRFKNCATLIVLFFSFLLKSQTPTVGLIQHNPESLDNGYVLFAPLLSDTTFLIDKCGKRIHTWPSNKMPGLSVFLLPNGSLLRTETVANSTFPGTGSRGGKIEIIDWNGNVTWAYTISDTLQMQNHDVYPMSNGNILVCIWVRKTNAEAIAAGRDPAILGTNLWSCRVTEIQPVGTNSVNIVWQWDLWDHLIQDFDSTKLNYGVVADHPELVNLNFNGSNSATTSDWIHLNAVSYNQQLDQIIISTHSLSEIYILDHSTTIAEAAAHSGGARGKGGDLLYRWGNPQAYKRGTSSDRKFYFQHTSKWIPQGLKDAGKIIIFNNGVGRPIGGNYSSVEIINTPVDSAGNYAITATQPFDPPMQDWIYTASPTPTTFFSLNMGSGQRLSNGNTLICEASRGHFFEVDSTNNIVWEYINPVSTTVTTQGNSPVNVHCFRADFYTDLYVAGAGYPLTPGDPIELSPYTYTCTPFTTNLAQSSFDNKISVVPNPSTGVFRITGFENETLKNIEVINKSGQKILNTKNSEFDLSEKSKGIYFVKVQTGDGKFFFRKIIKN